MNYPQIRPIYELYPPLLRVGLPNPDFPRKPRNYLRYDERAKRTFPVQAQLEVCYYKDGPSIPPVRLSPNSGFSYLHGLCRIQMSPSFMPVMDERTRFRFSEEASVPRSKVCLQTSACSSNRSSPGCHLHQSVFAYCPKASGYLAWNECSEEK